MQADYNSKSDDRQVYFESIDNNLDEIIGDKNIEGLCLPKIYWEFLLILTVSTFVFLDSPYMSDVQWGMVKIDGCKKSKIDILLVKYQFRYFSYSALKDRYFGGYISWA